ncbi:MAG: hypothetical protein AAGG81_08515, partial [Chlamydiota bacterium]
MEELLRYTLLQIAIFILILEVTILLMCAVAIFLIKFFSDQKIKRNEDTNNEITELIATAIREKTTPSFPKRCRRSSNIIPSL